jgi:putative membrane protein
MSDIETALKDKDKGTTLAEERTDLALQRTILASERTLMAWIRTAISMIGFGFSIYKFFQYQAEEIAAGTVRRPQAPRNLGMTLIALGTLGLSAAAWQHRRFLNELGATQHRHVWSVSFVVAICVILIGVITLYGVLLRHGPF